MIGVRMEQHPVGQGGLSSGQISNSGSSLRWIYDCGSNQDDALIREIRRAAKGGGLDLLFLSHLDSDHVSGVDRLLPQCPAREVVLPYMDADQLLATAARDVARGRLSHSFGEAVSDLAGWFAARGVETLTFVRGSDDDAGGGGDGPIFPDTPERGGERAAGDITAKWTVEPSPLEPAESGTLDPSSAAIEVRVVPREAALMLREGGTDLNWALIPYVHQPDARRLTRFRTLLTEEFGDPLDLAAIKEAGKSDAGRRRLRGCYDGLWTDHNLVSMTLYSGPVSQASWNQGYPRRIHRYFGSGYMMHSCLGLMLTGDAHLDQRKRRESFFRHYSRLAPLVGGLMLPHHGSIHNFHESLLDGFPNLEIAFACAGPNTYGHPHPDVRSAVEEAAIRYRRVSHKRRRGLMVDIEWDR